MWCGHVSTLFLLMPILWQTSESRIIDGKEVTDRDDFFDQYSFFAGWQFGNNFCQGALIKPQVVLTSAWCGDGIGVPDDVVGSYVTIGAWKKNDDGFFAEDSKTVKVIDTYTHKKYDPAQPAFDIRALILEEPVTESQFEVIEVNLDDKFPKKDDKLKVMGFGTDKLFAVEYQDTVHVAEVNLIPDKLCADKYEGFPFKYEETNDKFLMCVASETEAVSACYGDEGAPVFTAEDPPKLVGIVSFTTNYLPENEWCGDANTATVATELSGLDKWVESFTFDKCETLMKNKCNDYKHCRWVIKDKDCISRPALVARKTKKDGGAASKTAERLLARTTRTAKVNHKTRARPTESK